MSLEPLVSIIIPHYAGDILLTCLERLHACTNTPVFETIIVNDGPGNDALIQLVQKKYPAVIIFKTDKNRGFGAACNLGLRHTKCRYAVLLNNDAEVTPGWLIPLVDAMEGNPNVALCQPKIHNTIRRDMFDAGGAGGLLDIFGYPFAYGSLVHTIEVDHGQYDAPHDLAWAHGSALLVRMSVLGDIGYFDEDFKMQAEEIDLCCRALLGKYGIRSVPSSVVFHHFGWTLKKETVERFYLSHRNTIVCMLKNWPLSLLIWVFPLRLALELSTVLYGLLYKLNWKQPLGVMMALTWIATHPLAIARRRNQARRQRHNDFTALSDRLYKGSILWSYFIRRKKTCGQMLS